MLSAVTTSLLICAVKSFIWYVAVCCVCVCAVQNQTTHGVFRGSSFVFSAVTTSLLALRRLFGMWLYVVYVCACLMSLSVGCLVVNCECVFRKSA